MKKLLKILGVVLLIFLIAAIALPFLFKDKIAGKLKQEINKQVNANVNYGKVGLSWFKDFPLFTVSVGNVSVINKAPFEGDTLVYASQLQATVNLKSLLGDEVSINSFSLIDPVINILVDKEGAANYDVAKETTKDEDENASSEDLKFNLKKYEIRNGQFSYVDETSDFKIYLKDLDHQGKGDFTASQFVLSTKSKLKSATMISGGVPYLNRVAADIDADLDINLDESKYTFKNNNIQLNAIDLSLDGFVQLLDNDAIGMDLKLNAKETSFKNLLSLVPAMYTKDFNKVETSGNAKLSGFAKGTYSGESYPAFQVLANANNASFKYPDLPNAVEAIAFDADIKHPGGDLDKLEIKVENLHAEVNNQPIDLNLQIKNPMSDPDVKMDAVTKIDLAAVKGALPLEGVEDLSGMLDANVRLAAKMSSFEDKRYDQISTDGHVQVQNMLYNSESLGIPADIKEIDLSFNPQNVTLNKFTGQIGESDIKANGTLDNFFPYLFKGETLEGNVVLAADYINVNEWMSEEESTNGEDEAVEVFKVPADYDISFNTNIKKLLYTDIELTNVFGKIKIADEQLRFTQFQGEAFDGNLAMDGTYSTKNVDIPDVDLDFEVLDADIVKVASSMGSIEKFAPIVKYIEGTASSSLKMKGKLDENMYPELMSLTGNGNAAMIKGTLKNFEPLTKLATALNIDKLKKIDMVSLRAFFDIKEGRVELKQPFKFNYQGIGLEIDGSHGLDNTLNYTLNALVPSDRLNDVVNSKFNFMVSQLNTPVGQIKMPSEISVPVTITGTMDKPIIKPDFEGAAQNAFDMAKGSVKEQVKEVVTEKVNEVKTEVKDKVNTEVDKQKEAAQKKIEEEKAKAKKQAEEAAKKEADKLKEEGKKAIKGIFGKKKK